MDPRLYASGTDLDVLYYVRKSMWTLLPYQSIGCREREEDFGEEEVATSKKKDKRA